MSQGFETHALDPSTATVAGPVSEGIVAKAGTIDRLPFPDDHFDTDYCSEILEHIDDSTSHSGLREIARGLKRGDHLIGPVPFGENLSTSRAAVGSYPYVMRTRGRLIGPGNSSPLSKRARCVA